MKRCHFVLVPTVLACIATGAIAQLLDGNELKINRDYGLYASEDGDTLEWPDGTYAIDGDDILYGSLDQVFALDSAVSDGVHHARENLTIDATGVTLVVTDPTIGVFRMTGCDGLKIVGLTVTYDPLPYNQGEVVAVDVPNGTFDVEVDAGFPMFDHPGFQYGTSQTDSCACWGALYDTATGLPKEHTFWHAATIDDYDFLSGTTYRLTINPADAGYLGYFETGDSFVYLMRRNVGPTFTIPNSEPTGAPFNRPAVTIKDCTGQASPHAFIALNNCPKEASTGNAEVRDCTITKVTSSRLASINADGFYVQDCRVGPLLEGCTFEGMMDDGMNLFTTPRMFQTYPYSGYWNVMNVGPGPRLVVGDFVQIFDPSSGGTAHLEIIAITGGGASDTDWKQIALEAAVPGLTSSIHVYNVAAANPGFEIRENTIKNHRGKAAVLPSALGTFEDNLIEGSSMNGIALSNVYGTSMAPQAIAVTGNTIKNCGYTILPSHSSPDNVATGAAIHVGVYALAGNLATYASSGFHDIQGNTLENWNTAGVYVNAAHHTLVGNNTFKGAHAAASRAVTIAPYTTTTDVDRVLASLLTGSTYAVRIESGAAASVTATNIVVTSPVQQLEDLRP